jgi:rare lipoprotein A (peptidoglycan hydrolase)
MIDLSYAAAKELDIIRYGYSPVEVSVYTPTIVPYKLAEPEHPLPILELTEIPQIPLSEILTRRKSNPDSVKLKKIK